MVSAVAMRFYFRRPSNWIRTILSYPLTPFFVLFCNVVGTSNVDDYKLLQAVTESISSLVMEYTYVEKIHMLCDTLLTVCKPMVQQHPSFQPAPLTIMPHENTTSHRQSAGIQLEQTERQDYDAVTDTSMQVAANVTLSWDDEMMSQLFHCQPSLDWFDSEILDATLWDFSADSLVTEPQY
jgi:hypothetical protein